MKLLLITIYLISINAFGQTPKVPSKMKFANIKLKLSDDVREDMQKKVDALTRSKKYFRIKVKKAGSYFPIIEQMFKEEGVPQDFKYLVIQESGFIADAVSKSNAVGYWQFKKETAKEVGLRVDTRIDERLSIIASSRGAAKYLQKNNLYFNNWLHSLQAYQMGARGAQRWLTEIESGASTMNITTETYWYVITFLSHKIAFERAVELFRKEAVKMKIYDDGRNKSLREISKEMGVSLDSLKEYNKWIKIKNMPIPNDKKYAVVIPMYKNLPHLPTITAARKETGREGVSHSMSGIKQFKVNGLPAIMSNTKITINDLANEIDIIPSDFSSYNEISFKHTLLPNQVYYLKKKRKKGKIYYHTIKKGEKLWTISQEYGIRVSSIKKMNRIPLEVNKIEEGRVLWLKKKIPKTYSVEYK